MWSCFERIYIVKKDYINKCDLTDLSFILYNYFTLWKTICFRCIIWATSIFAIWTIMLSRILKLVVYIFSFKVFFIDFYIMNLYIFSLTSYLKVLDQACWHASMLTSCEFHFFFLSLIDEFHRNQPGWQRQWWGQCHALCRQPWPCQGSQLAPPAWGGNSDRQLGWYASSWRSREWRAGGM